jgi:hypothetical protein
LKTIAWLRAADTAEQRRRVVAVEPAAVPIVAASTTASTGSSAHTGRLNEPWAGSRQPVERAARSRTAMGSRPASAGAGAGLTALTVKAVGAVAVCVALGCLPGRLSHLTDSGKRSPTSGIWLVS